MSTQTTTTQAASGAEGDWAYDAEFAGDRLSRLKRAWSNHVMPDEADHVWLLRMATKGVDALAPAPAPQPAGAERVDLGSYAPALIHYQDDDRLEYVSSDVATVTRHLGAGFAILLDMKTREPVGFYIEQASKIVPASLPAALGRGEGTAGASSGFDPSRGFAEIAAKQATLGLGLVDITIIRHEGKAGVLFIPRADHIEFGEGGRIQAGDYWPTANDIVLWVDGEGPGVAISYLSQFTPAPCDGSGAAGETEGLDPKGDSAVTEGQAPHPQSPSLSEVGEASTPDPVGEAKALLEGLPKWLGPQQWIEVCRKTGDHKQADRFEAALATLTASQEQDGGVRR